MSSKRTPDPRRVDIAAACADSLSLSGHWPLGALDRLAEGDPASTADTSVDWAARFETRPVAGGPPERWLDLQASAQVRRECQRCLRPVTLALVVDRRLRFVDDEATAAALDADSEDDVLVASRQFDLQALVEDELLLSMPLVPMHEACPDPLVRPAADEPAEPQAHPFAALAALKRGTGH
jgi:uncharacterized protein